MSKESVVRVELGDRAYDVMIGRGLLEDAGRLLAPIAQGRRLAIVTDETVAGLHLPRLENGLRAAGFAPSAIVLPPGEGQKSFAGLERLCDELLALELERKDLIIALGGGVIGDLVGLAAGLLKRGMDFVQIPTTLLAQVDSSVGGKTAINARAGKNLVGLFHQPRLVLADLDALATLPARELRAGYAEVVKYGLIDDPAFFDWCEANGAAVLAGDLGAAAVAVERSVRAKARIVALDEREQGPRALLNLGHTFAHAFEVEAGMDGALLHGEAVGLGMALAFQLSQRRELCTGQDAARVASHLGDMGFARRARDLPGGPFDADRLIAAMAQDKKNEGGRLTLILARGIGRSFVEKGADAGPVKALLAESLG